MLDKPNSLEAEKGLLGSMLLDPDKCSTCVDYNITTDHFYLGQHRLLYTQIMDMYTNGQVLDALTLYNKLDKEDNLKSVGGSEYLLKLQDHTLIPSHSQHYAQILKDKLQLRKEIGVLEEGLRIAYEGDSVSNDVIGKLMGSNSIREHSVDSIIDNWEDAKQGIMNSIPTPYPDLDKRTGGIRKGMVTVFTGRSKSGKSMFLAHWYNYLGQQGIPTLAIPLEDKYDITIKRMSSNYGNYNYNVLDQGGRYINVNGKPTWHESTDKELQTGKKHLQTVSKLPIYFYDRKITPKELKSIAMKYKRKYDIQIIFVDGAKDLKRPTGKYNDTGFDEEISQAMCEIAEQLNVAIVSIHHLTKIPDNEIISVNDIRGSGNIISDSRSVYALQSRAIEPLLNNIGYYPDYDEEGNITTRIFHCLSNNHGTTGMKVLNTQLSHCQFIEKTK